MSLDAVLTELGKARYDPRLLSVAMPYSAMERMSGRARLFLECHVDAFPTPNSISAAKLMIDKWARVSGAQQEFAAMPLADRIETLCIINFFVHETTHRADLLISPFGLQYYSNMLCEYWRLQIFFPSMLDDMGTISQLHFLAGLSDRFEPDNWEDAELSKLWTGLEELIHVSYAWGDVADIKPLGRYVVVGWGEGVEVPPDPFGVGTTLEPVTVLEFFHSFRPPDARFWYLRPMTILETKAVCNSLLFTLHLLAPTGLEECRRFYEAVYIDNREQLPRDYLFLFDLGARIYEVPTFEAVLATGNRDLIQSVLRTLSSVCWFALQAPPCGKGEDSRATNPVLRLWAGFILTTAVIQRKLDAPRSSMVEMFSGVETHTSMRDLRQVTIAESLARCRQRINWLTENNMANTWNPEIRDHFSHVLNVMRPYFIERPATYASRLGIAETGSPLMHWSNENDTNVLAFDYVAPEGARKWFELRNDLYFTLNEPTGDTIDRIHAHFNAFLSPHFCECGSWTDQWVSRFSSSWNLRCHNCGKEKIVSRDEATILSFDPDKS